MSDNEIRYQAISLIKRLKEAKQPKILKTISDLDAGMGFVMLFLYEKENGVYASNISENMGVSRARVGALLKKMEKKSLIIKTKSTEDSRIEIINLTDHGKEIILSLYEKIIQDTIKILDIIGYEELNNYLITSEKIDRILNE